MKKVKVEMFEAEDGSRWPSEVECKKHESTSIPLAQRLFSGFSGKPASFIESAMCYDASVDGARDLADAIEQAAKRCAQARIDQGGAKRKRKEKTNAPTPVGETKPEGHSVIDRRPLTIGSPVEGVGLSPAGIFPTKDNQFPAHGPREETRQA